MVKFRSNWTPIVRIENKPPTGKRMSRSFDSLRRHLNIIFGVSISSIMYPNNVLGLYELSTAGVGLKLEIKSEGIHDLLAHI